MTENEEKKDMKLLLAFLLSQHGIETRKLGPLSYRLNVKLSRDIYFCCGMKDINCGTMSERIVVYDIFNFKSNSMTLIHKKSMSMSMKDNIQKELLRQMEEDSTLHEILKSTLKPYPFDF